MLNALDDFTQEEEFTEEALELALQNMNEENCVVRVGGKTVVMWFAEDRKRRIARYSSFQAHKDYYANKVARVMRDDDIKKVSIANAWLCWRDRRTYKGVTFQPLAGDVVDGKINLWRGWGAEPRLGDWSLMKDHIKIILANGDEEFARYILMWAAWAVQNPGLQSEVVLVLKGREGTGRGIFGRSLARIFGQHALHISNHKDMVGEFNIHLQDAAFVFADEAFWPGDKSAEGTLKRIATEDTIFVQAKYVDKYSVRNCLKILMASNADWVVPAGLDARRYAIKTVSDARMGDKPYFIALYHQMENGGLEAMLHDLLNMDLQGWHPRDSVPKNEDLMHEKITSLDPEDAWLFDLLNSGRLPWGCSELGTCPRHRLFDAYIRHAQRTGARRRSIETKLGVHLKNRLPSLMTQKGAWTAWQGAIKVSETGRIYRFPPLAECRRNFDQALGHAYPWSEADGWLEEPLPLDHERAAL